MSQHSRVLRLAPSIVKEPECSDTLGLKTRENEPVSIDLYRVSGHLFQKLYDFPISAVVSFQEKRFRPLSQLRRLFNKNYWINTSTLYDLVLLVVNTIMRITLLIPLFGSHVAVTVLVGGFLQDSLGDAPSIEMSWVWIAIAFSVSYLILDEYRF